MALSAGNSLVYAVLEERFGALTAHVAATLSARGRITLAQLVAAAKLPGRHVRDCLVILIHHQLVDWCYADAAENAAVADSAVQTLYRFAATAFHASLLYPTLLASFPSSKVYLLGIMANGVAFEAPPSEVAHLVRIKPLSGGTVSPLIMGESAEKRVRMAEAYQLFVPSVLRHHKHDLVLRAFAPVPDSPERRVLAALLAADVEVMTPVALASSLGLAVDQCKAVLERLFWSVDWLERRAMPSVCYRVKWLDLQAAMARGLLSTLVAAKWTSASVRLVNLLRTEGVLQDKTLSAKGLMPLREVRERMFLLWTHGVVQLQEVPRTADRAASKTFFLWALREEQRSRPLLLAKAVAELRAQHQHLRQLAVANQPLVDKLARPGISIDMLSVGERGLWLAYQHDLAIGYTQFGRLLNDLVILKYLR